MALFSSDKSSEESGHINVIASVRAKAGHEAEVRALFEALVLPSRAEAGCKGYHLHVDKKDAASFYTYEEWTSEDALRVHLEGAKPMLEKARGLLEGDPKIIVLEHLI